MADTDGGAHVDPELDEAYMDLSRNNSLGWVFTTGDESFDLNNPVPPCIRQIAHEVLTTLKRVGPQFFPDTSDLSLEKAKSEGGSMISHPVAGVEMNGPTLVVRGKNGEQTVIDFVEDSASKRDELGNRSIYKGNIGERNDDKGWAR